MSCNLSIRLTVTLSVMIGMITGTNIVFTSYGHVCTQTGTSNRQMYDSVTHYLVWVKHQMKSWGPYDTIHSSNTIGIYEWDIMYGTVGCVEGASFREWHKPTFDTRNTFQHVDDKSVRKQKYIKYSETKQVILFLILN